MLSFCEKNPGHVYFCTTIFILIYGIYVSKTNHTKIRLTQLSALHPNKCKKLVFIRIFTRQSLYAHSNLTQESKQAEMWDKINQKEAEQVALTAADRRRLETAKAEVSQEIRLLEEKMELAEKVICEYSFFWECPKFQPIRSEKVLFSLFKLLIGGNLGPSPEDIALYYSV